MNRFDECINLSNEIEPCFLCSWNNHEIVEIHTKKTLHAKYDGTNLFDYSEDFGNNFNEEMVISLDEWMDTINFNDSMWLEIHNDNFTIQRIK
jgi:hypothetical protein